MSISQRGSEANVVESQVGKFKVGAKNNFECNGKLYKVIYICKNVSILILHHVLILFTYFTYRLKQTEDRRRQREKRTHLR